MLHCSSLLSLGRIWAYSQVFAYLITFFFILPLLFLGIFFFFNELISTNHHCVCFEMTNTLVRFMAFLKVSRILWEMVLKNYETKASVCVCVSSLSEYIVVLVKYTCSLVEIYCTFLALKEQIVKRHFTHFPRRD